MSGEASGVALPALPGARAYKKPQTGSCLSIEIDFSKLGPEDSFLTRVTRTGGKICYSVAADLTEFQRTLIGKALSQEVYSFREMKVAFPKLAPWTTMYSWGRTWTKRSNDGAENITLKKGSGRIPILSSMGLSAFAKSGQQANVNNTSLRSNEVIPHLLAIANKEKVDHTGFQGMVTSVSLNTQKTWYKAMKATSVKGRALSQARYDSILDPRNALLQDVMARACFVGRNPEFIVNHDSTQVVVSGVLANLKLVFFKGADEDDKADANLEVRRLDNYIVPFAIKVHVMATGGGDLAPIVLHYSSKELEPDDFFVHEVSGLSLTLAGTGYVVITKTREGNKRYHKWYVETIVIKYCELLRKNVKNPDPPTATFLDPEIIMVSSDGEAQQVKVCLYPDIQTMLLRLNIQIIKLCASCSLNHQPLDKSPLFRNTKTTMREMPPYDITNPSVEAKLEVVFNDNKLALTADTKAKFTRGALMVLASLKVNATPAILKQGFKRAGVLGDPSTWDDTTGMIPYQQCTHKLKKTEYALVSEKMPEMMEAFARNGQVTDAYLDNIGYPRSANNNGQNKEELVNYRERCLLLVNPETVARDTERRERKLRDEAELKARNETRKAGRLETEKVAKTYSEIQSLTKSAAEMRVAVMETLKTGRLSVGKGKTADFSSAKALTDRVDVGVKTMNRNKSSASNSAVGNKVAEHDRVLMVNKELKRTLEEDVALVAVEVEKAVKAAKATKTSSPKGSAAKDKVAALEAEISALKAQLAAR